MGKHLEDFNLHYLGSVKFLEIEISPTTVSSVP